MNKQDVLAVLSKVYDPEIPNSVVELNIVDEQSITIEDGKVKIEFTPTAPYCPMGGAIGFLIKYVIEDKLKVKAEVKLKKGTHVQEDMLNKMLSDEKKYKDTIKQFKENGLLESCIQN